MYIKIYFNYIETESYFQLITLFQVKCNKQLNLLDETVEESDEEINNLKQRIRLRRRQKQEERRKIGVWSRDLLSDGITDSTIIYNSN